jgi:hypothetical protein
MRRSGLFSPGKNLKTLTIQAGIIILARLKAWEDLK